jgi:hypothetical protein
LNPFSYSFFLKIKWLAVIFFFFLPFAYALSIRIFFPLKISEIAIFFISLLYLLYRPKRVFRCLKEKLLCRLEVRVAAGLLGVVFLSTLYNTWQEYPYPLSYYETRIGYTADSWLKAGYVVVVMVVFLFSWQAFVAFPNQTIRIILTGGVLASLYAWYLFISSLFGLPVWLLPGMDLDPQTYPLGELELIRCGTFKEGNYMGFFLLITIILAVYRGRLRYAFFFFLTIATTLSVMALFTGALFLNLYFLRQFYRSGQVKKVCAMIAVQVVLLAVVASTESFYNLFTSRFVYTGQEKELERVYSVWDRINSLKVSARIGWNNPVLGVGLQNYGLHYDHFNQEEELRRTFKSIPNNVYAELFAELGVPGLILFLLFLLLLYRRSRQDSSGALQFGLLMVGIYFFAFPSFTFLQAWAFFGLLASLPNKSIVGVAPSKVSSSQTN